MGELRYDGKVVLVTGSGAGLGKVYALEFARRGAFVVVNDLGSTPGGVGESSKVADKVVEEIRAAGGKAVANYDSVEFGEKLVQTALDNFGKIDIVINNAGILRDRSFNRMTEAEWDLIIKIHLKGSFSVTKAAWDHMKKQGFGRIIMTSSPSGIYGNYGQSNYSAAKMGLVGFANTLALEGKKYGIFVNTIAPTAWTRLTENLMPPDSEKEMKPDFIMPLVVYLCHDSCTETGGVFEVAGGLVCKLRWQRTKGAVLRELGKPMRPEDIKDNWTAVTDWNQAEACQTIGEATMKAGEAIGRVQSGDHDLSSCHAIRPNVAKKHVFAPITTRHDPYSIILYALGVGSSTTQKDHLKFLFESSENFCALPSFGVVPPFESLNQITSVEGLDINPTQILHGEQYLEICKPIPTEGKMTSHPKLVDVLDKGSGCALIMNVDTFDESGEKVFFNQFVTFVVGAGGFRGKRNSDELKPHAAPPKRKPDAVVEQKTGLDQAALYRLSGDHNPLHIEPAFAAMGGFKQPILHGLCSFGFATRHVMETYGNNEPSSIKAVKVRFAKPVLPGQTLRTEMWKEGSRVYFQCVVAETGKPSLSGAYVDLNEDTAGAAPGPTEQLPQSAGLASDALFEGAAERLTPEIVRKVKAIFQWDITVDGKVAQSWEMDLLNGDGKIARGQASNPGCSITISDSDAMNVFTGKANPQQLFMSGKMKVKGNVMLATKLDALFKAQAAKL